MYARPARDPYDLDVTLTSQRHSVTEISAGGGGGGSDLVLSMPRCVCPKVRTWVLFWLQGSEMSENISLKMLRHSIWVGIYVEYCI